MINLEQHIVEHVIWCYLTGHCRSTGKTQDYWRWSFWGTLNLHFGFCNVGKVDKARSNVAPLCFFWCWMFSKQFQINCDPTSPIASEAVINKVYLSVVFLILKVNWWTNSESSVQCVVEKSFSHDCPIINFLTEFCFHALTASVSV